MGDYGFKMRTTWYIVHIPSTFIWSSVNPIFHLNIYWFISLAVFHWIFRILPDFPILFISYLISQCMETLMIEVGVGIHFKFLQNHSSPVFSRFAWVFEMSHGLSYLLSGKNYFYTQSWLDSSRVSKINAVVNYLLSCMVCDDESYLILSLKR